MKFKILRPMMRVWRSKTYRSGMLGWSVGIGMVIGFSPTIGLQMLVCIAAALLWNRFHEIKLNLPAMLVGSLVVNPLTMAPTYVLYYQIGCQVIACRGRGVNEDFFLSLSNVSQLGWHIASPIIVGSLPFMLIGLPLGIYLGNKVEALLEARRATAPERRRVRAARTKSQRTNHASSPASNS
jgi:uncharacterized protein (DUF2062 family)